MTGFTKALGNGSRAGFPMTRSMQGEAGVRGTLEDAAPRGGYPAPRPTGPAWSCRIWWGCFCGLLLCWPWFSGLGAQTLPWHTLQIAGQTLVVEVADTPAAKARGLMFRTHLPEQQGMLFIWPYPQPVAMWMKNTPLPLSVAFLDETGTILNLADMEPHSLDVHPSAGPARYALEVGQGWFARHGIAVGDRVEGLPGLRNPGS